PRIPIHKWKHQVAEDGLILHSPKPGTFSKERLPYSLTAPIIFYTSDVVHTIAR
ncbi:unnamed protein product, partial [Candidula unifasciata]